MCKMKILGIRLSNRVQEAKDVQNVLTNYGCSIKTRLGLHEATQDCCSMTGIILLELTGPEKEWEKLENELKAIEGVEIQSMCFEN